MKRLPEIPLLVALALIAAAAIRYWPQPPKDFPFIPGKLINGDAGFEDATFSGPVTVVVWHSTNVVFRNCHWYDGAMLWVICPNEKAVYSVDASTSTFTTDSELSAWRGYNKRTGRTEL